MVKRHTDEGILIAPHLINTIVTVIAIAFVIAFVLFAVRFAVGGTFIQLAACAQNVSYC